MAKALKIFAIVRARNEERNIGRFVRSYAWADDVLVADGGSTDLTTSTAFDCKARIRSFYPLVESNGIERNPEGEHLNFLIDWALDEGADWVIFDDCDCWPNYLLEKDGRAIIEEADREGKQFAFAVRLYLWGHERHFPYLAKPEPLHGQWEPSLWAWSLKSNLRPSTRDPWLLSWDIPVDPALRANILPPHCLLHNPWPDEETLERKMHFYNTSEKTRLNDPRDWAGPIEELPDWAH